MRLPAGRARARRGGLRGRHRRRRARRRAAGPGSGGGRRGPRGRCPHRRRAAECDVGGRGPELHGHRHARAACRSGSARVAGPEAFVPGSRRLRRALGIDRRGVPRQPASRRLPHGHLGRQRARRATSPTSSPSWPPTTGTRAIGLFVETVRRPQAFAAALALAAEAGKPVVCLKVGRSQAAARAALAHSGAVVGLGARVLGAAAPPRGDRGRPTSTSCWRRSRCLGRRRWPRGLRIAGVSESGGECGLLADHGEERGIPFAPFDGSLKARLVAAFPNYTLPENPARLLGHRRRRARLPGTPRAAARDRRLRRAARPGRPLAPPRRPRRAVVPRDRARRSPTPSRAPASFRP